MNMIQQEEKNVLYFSDLSSNVVENDLRLFLKDYADGIRIINLDQKTPSTDYQKYLRAKVVFKDSETANKVRTTLNLKKIKGHAVRIMWDERDNSIRYNTKNNLFIKGIPTSTSPREVYEYFMKYGDISSLKIPEDEFGTILGYGYITYYNPDDTEKVIIGVTNQKLNGANLEVSRFQRKNERNFKEMSSNARSVYLKNFPLEYKENDLNKLCSKYGKVEKIIMHQGYENYLYGIVIFTTEEDAKNAIEKLDGLDVNGQKLYAQPLQSKYERKQLIENQIRESNLRLNEQYHLCNLHIRNIPYSVTEDDLRKIFEKFGNIKSLKIEKYILETKEGDKFKEVPTSKGFGYICYDNQESAKNAKEAYNMKFLEGFESWNRPILIDYFMNKAERMIYANKNSEDSLLNNNMFKMPQMPFMGMYPHHPFMRMPMQGFTQRNMGPRTNNYKPHMNNEPNRKPPVQPPVQNSKLAELDMNLLNSLDTEQAKREYLGEIIYNAIEVSPIADREKLDIDTISKITGMIINISNLDEVILTVKSDTTLNNRIEEGLQLLKNAGVQEE